VSGFTGIIMSILVTFITQQSAVRDALNILPLPANPPKLPTFMESRAALYKYLQDQKKAAEKQTKNHKP
jgi:hypothetical protein